MTTNMGSVDRWIRGIAGVAIIGWGVWAGNPWGAIGAIPLITALVGTCPAYLPFGLHTGGKSK
jgi:hypothetical protein